MGKTTMFLRKPKTNESSLRLYMDPIEYSQVLAVLEAVQPARLLEWGAGGSTAAILGDCPFVKRHVSVEHDSAWAAKVRSVVQDPRLDLQLVPPDRPLKHDRPSEQDVVSWCAEAEQDSSIMQAYIQRPSLLEPSYDFVLVDGRARCFCLAEGYRLLRSGGALILHDAQRPDYRKALSALGRFRLLDPWKSGQIAVVHKP
jgi:predicted O-methyltransferase YrrM